MCNVHAQFSKWLYDVQCAYWLHQIYGLHHRWAEHIVCRVESIACNHFPCNLWSDECNFGCEINRDVIIKWISNKHQPDSICSHIPAHFIWWQRQQQQPVTVPQCQWICWQIHNGSEAARATRNERTQMFINQECAFVPNSKAPCKRVYCAILIII